MLGAPPCTGGPLTCCTEARRPPRRQPPEHRLAPGPRGHHHVWQEAQRVLWGLRMVGDGSGVVEGMGVTSCAVLLSTVGACGFRDLRLCLNPGCGGHF